MLRLPSIAHSFQRFYQHSDWLGEMKWRHWLLFNHKAFSNLLHYFRKIKIILFFSLRKKFQFLTIRRLLWVSELISVFHRSFICGYNQKHLGEYKEEPMWLQLGNNRDETKVLMKDHSTLECINKKHNHNRKIWGALWNVVGSSKSGSDNWIILFLSDPNDFERQWCNG